MGRLAAAPLVPAEPRRRSRRSSVHGVSACERRCGQTRVSPETPTRPAPRGAVARKGTTEDVARAKRYSFLCFHSFSFSLDGDKWRAVGLHVYTRLAGEQHHCASSFVFGERTSGKCLAIVSIYRGSSFFHISWVCVPEPKSDGKMPLLPNTPGLICIDDVLCLFIYFSFSITSREGGLCLTLRLRMFTR